MSEQELRNSIIRENIPILLKSLTGFDSQDENLQKCKQFASSILRIHRSISTNSHEVRRKINAMKEKFTVDNFAMEADILERLCDEIIKHPACSTHYELDVQWSILDLLLSLAYNPTGALRRQAVKATYEVELNEEEDTESTSLDHWRDLLKEDFLPLHDYSLSDSDLSNWSDEDDIVMGQLKGVDAEKSLVPIDQFVAYKNSTLIKPPLKEIPFSLYKNPEADEQFPKSVQAAWWQFGASAPEVESQNVESNFALLFSNYLRDHTHSLRPNCSMSIVSEGKLVRELLWMFHGPVNSKFFELKDHVVQLRHDVSIPSVTQHGLHSFLESKFLPYIRIMHILQKFIDTVYKSDDLRTPKTLECYAANLKILLNPIWQQLLAYEELINSASTAKQPAPHINTIINLHSTLRGSFEMLEKLYEIHRHASLPIGKHPSHILSMYLLTNLLDFSQTSSCQSRTNMSLALFLTTIKIFCIIIDIWWTEGRLDDWKQEFIAERVSGNAEHNVRIRSYKKDKATGFYLADNISEAIQQSSLFRLLIEHSKEAGSTLNLLYEINRIGELKNACAAIKGKLYDVFLAEVLAYVAKLSGEFKPKEIKEVKPETCEELVAEKSHSSLSQTLTTQDEFLLMAFSADTTSENMAAQQTADDKHSETVLSLVEKFEQTGQLLPTQEVVLTPLKNILKTRIAFADAFVVRLFLEEFGLITHLQNIRKVLLLEDGEVMDQFHANLFKKVEARESWANPFLLTTQLDDLLCPKYPEMTSMFSITINSSLSQLTDKVCQAVDGLHVSYNASRELEHVITQQNIHGYNKVFRFLLKIKWAMETLNKLRYLPRHKRCNPYETLSFSELLMRRLEQLRFWIIKDMQIIQFHLMTHVLHAMGMELDIRLSKCLNLQELKTVHRVYVDTMCQHCCLGEDLAAIKLGIEQLINLIYVLRLEWKSCRDFIEKSGPLSAHIDSESDADEDALVNDYVSNSQVNDIELTFVRCHQYLANNLNKEVYLNRRTFLAGLSAAFNASLPY